MQLPAVTQVEATVTPQPEPPAKQPTQPGLTKAEAMAELAAQPAAPTAINYLKGVRGLLALESCTEAELLAFGRDQKGWDESLSSLEEIAMAAPSKLEQVYNEWGAIVKNLKASRV